MNLFIVGAGFTKAIFPDAPLNKDLLRVLSAESPASVSSGLRERYKTEDIEVALTKLDVDVASCGEEGLRKIRKNIENELANYFSSFCMSEAFIARSRWMSTLIDDVFSSADVAVSLNYDCVLEGALDCRGKWSPNGGYGYLDNPLATDDRTPKSPITVLKIHGSSNFVIAPYADKPTASAISFEFDERIFPRSAKNAHFGYGAGTGRSYVIAPSFVKIPTVEISYLMIDALTASTQASNLVIIGSGMRPEDGFLNILATNFLRQPNWRSRRIVVVDPAAESICNRLKNYWGVNVADQILPIPGELQTSIAALLAAVKDRRT